MSELAIDLAPRTITRIRRMADKLYTPSAIALDLELPVAAVRKALDDYGVPIGQTKRCPSCGWRVVMPCRKCRLER